MLAATTLHCDKMLQIKSYIPLVLLSYLSTTGALSSPAGISIPRLFLGGKVHSYFPIRCQRRGIHDAKTCIVTELSQDRPDELTVGGTLIVKELAEVDLHHWHGIRTIAMAISIDCCRRVDWTKPVGPLDLPDRRIPNASIETIVQELFFLQPRDAIALAMNNALASAQEARAFLNKAAPLAAGQTLDFSLELEADLKNATIKLIDDVLCKGIFRVATWIAI